MKHGAWIARLQLLDAVRLNAQYQTIPSSHISTVFLQLADRSSDHEELHRRRRRQFDSPHGRMEEFQPLTLSVPRRKRHHGRWDEHLLLCRTPYSRQRCAGQLAAQFSLLSRCAGSGRVAVCDFRARPRLFFPDRWSTLVSPWAHLGIGVVLARLRSPVVCLRKACTIIPFVHQPSGGFPVVSSRQQIPLSQGGCST